jgi:aminopeptidase-like protein
MIKKYYDIAKSKLYPLHRSITGNGIRKTLSIIKREFHNLKIKKIKSGTKAFDWTLPEEWNVIDAYILDKHNNKIIDFKKNNLHLINYSIPINKIVSKKDLLRKIYFLKNQPNAIPYVTSYYKKIWGFCTSYNFYKFLKKKYDKDDKFLVFINSKFNPKGHLNYGELVLRGNSKKEILISTYICHPSMANNELSGPIVSMSLINYFSKKKLKKSIRFVFIPETIGSIAYLSKNLANLKKKIIGGYNLSCLGDERQYSCMFSKYKNSPSDEAIIESFKKLKIKKYKIYSFLERGSDERQYNSPKVDLKISSIFRSKYSDYPEYHTSLDDFELVTLKGCMQSFNVVKKAVNILLEREYPESKVICEPNMSKRNLYPTLSIKNIKKNFRKNLDFLIYADGSNSINKIGKFINLDLKKTLKIYHILKKNKLVI